ncbi:MAG: hypothetical protein HKO65_16420 [Gemmatimonadetes bacterium]|nr:hypothetical protein [Gemmatimonadota bacterium]
MLKSASPFWPVGVVLVLMGTVVLGFSAPDGQERVEHRVNITGSEDAPRAAPETIQVRRGDFISWDNPYGPGVRVVITPADTISYPPRLMIYVKGRQRIKLMPNVTPGVYKYTVTVMRGNVVVGEEDPHIDIRP